MIFTLRLGVITLVALGALLLNGTNVTTAAECEAYDSNARTAGTSPDWDDSGTIAQYGTVCTTTDRDDGSSDYYSRSERNCKSMPGFIYWKKDSGSGFNRCIFNPGSRSANTNGAHPPSVTAPRAPKSDAELTLELAKFANEHYFEAEGHFKAKRFAQAKAEYEKAADLYSNAGMTSTTIIARKKARISNCLVVANGLADKFGIRWLNQWKDVRPLCVDDPEFVEDIDRKVQARNGNDCGSNGGSCANRDNAPRKNLLPFQLPPYDRYSTEPDGYDEAECGSYFADAFDKGPIRYSCRVTQLAHLQKPGKDQVRKFVGRACARGETDDQARFNAGLHANELVRRMQIARGTQLGARPESNEIFVASATNYYCVRLTTSSQSEGELKTDSYVQLKFCNRSHQQIDTALGTRRNPSDKFLKFDGWYTLKAGECRAMGQHAKGYMYFHAEGDDGSSWGDAKSFCVRNSRFSYLRDGVGGCKERKASFYERKIESDTYTFNWRE